MKLITPEQNNNNIKLPICMFVKQAYQKRLKKQQEDLSKLLNVKKSRQPVIGSIKNDKVNYDKEEQFFSKDDVPQYARTVKEEINKLIDPDHLGLRKKDWNASVSVPKNFQKQETHEQKLLKIKLGFLDHPLPKYKNPQIWTGTQTRDDYTKWNVSNQLLNKEVHENLLKKTMSALQNTKMRQTQFLNSYANPLARTTTFIEAGKKKVQYEAEMRQKLRQNYIFNNPTASEEKINGAVFRLAYQTVVKQKKDDIEAQAMKTDFKANLTMTQKNKISVEFSHSGIWQRYNSKIAGQQQYYAWSCCMNEDKNGRGCNQMIKDKNKWNLTSFNNS